MESVPRGSVLRPRISQVQRLRLPILKTTEFAVTEDRCMAAPLRVYPEPLETATGSCAEPTVRVSLGDLLPLIALAHRHNYLWLQDFLDDEVSITSDLHEVLRAFRCYRPSA